MGQKIIPISLRLHKNKNWHSQWIVDKKDYSDFLHFDLEVRKYIEVLLIRNNIKINNIKINKISKNIYIYVYLNNILNTKNLLKNKINMIEHLNKYLNNNYNIKFFIINTKCKLIKFNNNFSLLFKYLKKKNRINFQFKKLIFIFSYAIAINKINIILKYIKENLEKKKFHNGYLKFINKFLDSFFLKNSNLLGYKLQIKGRINGARRKKKLSYQKGKLPLNTLDNNIQYAFDEFKTKSGICSLKIWFYLKQNNLNKPINKLISNKNIISTKQKLNYKYDSETFARLFNENVNSKQKKIYKTLQRTNTRTNN